ncbi:MAG: hypothetical protein COB02_15345 [Candidatus Cloacimonadota bacterium]|nr:MAG: hypothetical protein COB02_15345 [Candidatus Cloacimonadota bacterium]
MDSTLVKLIILIFLFSNILDCLVINKTNIDVQKLSIDSLLDSKVPKQDIILKEGKYCIDFSKTNYAFSISQKKTKHNKILKVVFTLYLDSKLLKSRYSLLFYKNPKDKRDYSSVLIDFNKYQKDKWIKVTKYIPNFINYKKSAIYFPLGLRYNYGVKSSFVASVTSMNQIPGIYLHKISFNNDLTHQSLILPTSDILVFLKKNYLIAISIVLIILMIFSRYYLFSFITFCLVLLSLIGLLFFPIVGTNILSDNENRAISQIETQCKTHLYKVSQLKNKYEFALSNHLNQINAKAKTIVDLMIATKQENSKNFNQKIQDLLKDSSDKFGLDYFICNLDKVYRNNRLSAIKSKLSVKQFIRLIFPIIMGKVMERKTTSPIKLDRYRKKVNILKEFIENVFDSAEFLQNFLSNPNRLFQLSFGSHNNTKGMDQSMWSYFIDNNGKFWLIFAKVQTDVIITNYSKEAQNYQSNNVKIQMFFSRNFFTFPKLTNHDENFDYILALSLINQNENLMYIKDKNQHYMYASLKHPNQQNIFISVKYNITKHIQTYRESLKKQEKALLIFIISLLILSYILTYLIKLPITRLSKSIDLILSNKKFKLNSLGFGQFKELEKVIIQQNTYLEKQKVIHSLSNKSFLSFYSSKQILVIIDHKVFSIDQKFIKKSNIATHLNQEVYLYIFDTVYLDDVLNSKIAKFILVCSDFNFNEIQQLNYQDPIFSSLNCTLVEKSLSKKQENKQFIQSKCFELEFYEH